MAKKKQGILAAVLATTATVAGPKKPQRSKVSIVGFDKGPRPRRYSSPSIARLVPAAVGPKVGDSGPGGVVKRYLATQSERWLRLEAIYEGLGAVTKLERQQAGAAVAHLAESGVVTVRATTDLGPMGRPRVEYRLRRENSGDVKKQDPEEAGSDDQQD